MNKIQLQQKLLQETKYSKWYLNIIENAQFQNRIKLDKLNEDYVYYENHHILPRSLFSDYLNLEIFIWNGILLTAKEHFIVHLCLWKHYKSIKHQNSWKMGIAIKMMASQGKYNSTSYQYFKINNSHTLESRKAISDHHNTPSYKIFNKEINSGENNPRAKRINIYDPQGIVQHKTYGNITSYVKENNLPHELVVSYLNKAPIYENLTHKSTITRLINKGHYKYKGWYSEEVN